MDNSKLEISIILPCQNEAEALLFCLGQIKKTIKQNNLSAEVIVSDSSTDESPEIAKKENVILLKHNKDGYGNAYLEAFRITKGKYIFMADADGTYDFGEIPNFLKYLRADYDFVIGNRFAGKMEKGAMPCFHKLGNPLLSGILRLFFGTSIKDSHCGMRAITKKSLQKIHLQTTGMEFASEMVIKSLKNNLKIKELPINYYKRKGKSKLKTFSDAWKHMRFMLLYSPLFLFFIPGIFLASAGAAFYFLAHPFFSSLLIITGYQLIIFSLFAKTYAIIHLQEKSEFMDGVYKYLTIERVSTLGFLTILLGVLFYFSSPIIALTMAIIGVQTIFSSFMLSILGIKK
ncbi:MAG: hypothetical protein A2528_02805 [Candidatus Staskawiczbacteria bacterium RIFOXYD2_FULL_37_9]|uniref:Glycosyltransferase 2-like domain-containing protein n=1 Tax=Candidatus Staskawiczbacteria bacterium RIFOXYB1_FULL_37_44 TaxID=1802223 RepID=A0A1G2IU94_9BACT|nr:MAG: hypothetical protein A2358_00870 [Candidatus Staskawiczbacteria bacterium RIFOXYB1_FULL_37_44]OGZ82919.1 MAG: hypothetical protein A2416_02900 [Candidatus Staskawiczbacteria bacterium RIFOXYC1_FULL_37_52]OGZ88618.1 MAG: hypothetical protein A2581_01585 [Candidatus Staskawiczbacteria bacterium RIFOXYD1_FULL_37_110]OGZ89167.1 MAG: hypothetical protein A2444_01930 [Candidatus Staskawiczbacteria bacterium RIFOXYC2_FULL_37_19]OGZ94896.1 MAG: hypothetical protein A2528_02805 [Candidatus Stask